ncbi:hypothetical protein M378DRAFT_165380 [Amanita muscaria Koide BX008]|uniref:Uncharacterized protein n=1 Tax=Amanita muscaria (strain Koide BX008) TaxID=946122 RepID=A0A0C2X0Q8_AMAMK|nr:hypothetical protein M378DRAFT_165380 [Amanita muscaria Koide BX008]
MSLNELIRWLTLSLRSLNAKNHLQSITISLNNENKTNAHRSMWKVLDLLLTGPPFDSGTFCGLIFNRRSSFSVFNRSDMTAADFDAVAKLLPVELPRINGKGLLQVERSRLVAGGIVFLEEQWLARA